MKRIEIDCTGFKNAVSRIEKAGWKILRHPNHPTTIHVAADKITEEQAKQLATLFGRTTYQEIDSGKRTVKKNDITPKLVVNMAINEVTPARVAVATAGTALAVATHHFWPQIAALLQ